MFREKEKANDILRYLISVSRGYQFKSPVSVRFTVLLGLKHDLDCLGAKWQVGCADNWIHRFQQKHKDGLQTPEGLILKEEKRLSKNGGVYKGVVVNSNKPYFEKPDFEKTKFEKKVFEKKDFSKKDFEKGNCGGVSCA